MPFRLMALTDDGDPTQSKAEQDAEIGGFLDVRWYACRQPERPADRNTCFHDRCTPCLIAAQAATQLHDWEFGGNMIPTMIERLEKYGEAEE